MEGQRLRVGPVGAFPAVGPLGVKVVSMEFLLGSREVPVCMHAVCTTESGASTARAHYDVILPLRLSSFP
jgi:hypothetical protein